MLSAKKAIIAGSVIPAFAGMPQAAQAEDTRIAIQVPITVHHTKKAKFGLKWNEGQFNNLGVLAELTTQIADLGAGFKLRAGVQAGFYDNSIYQKSRMAGFVPSVEKSLGGGVTLEAGLPFGMVSGYSADFLKQKLRPKAWAGEKPKDKWTPAAAPFFGIAVGLTDTLRLGTRIQMLPAHTGMKLLGKSKQETQFYSDAFSGNIVLSFKL